MLLAGKEDFDTLGLFPRGSKIRTLGDRSRCLVGIRVCETSSSEQGDVSSVGLPKRLMDAYARGKFGFDVEIIFSNATYQDTKDDFRSIPTD